MSSPCRISSVPKGAPQLTQLRDQEGKNPIFLFIEGGKGGGRGGAIKCFCFVYKERNFQEAPSQGGGHLSPNYEQQQSQAKERREIGGAKGPPNSLRQKPRTPPTHPQCIYPRGPIWDEEGGMYTGGGGTGLGGEGNNLSTAAVGGKGAGGSSGLGVPFFLNLDVSSKDGGDLALHEGPGDRGAHQWALVSTGAVHLASGALRFDELS